MEESKQLNVFKIPSVSTGKSAPTTLIGVLDASGSMGGCWRFAAESWNKLAQNHPNARILTFSSIAKERTMPITVNIDQYDCCSTNIMAGFVELNRVIALPEITENITVVFISDGQDDNSQTLSERLKGLSVPAGKKINFISVGVGSGFPTFVAMSLREIYHNGEPSLPPVFLINNTSNEVEWTEQFDQLVRFIGHSAKISVTPKVKILPWMPEVEEIYENSWVLSEANMLVVNSTTEVLKIETMNYQELISIARGWLSELQISSLKKQAKDDATIALKILNSLNDQFVNPKKTTETEAKTTFNQRILKKMQATTDYQIQAILKEVKNIANDQILSQLSDSEAAKRLAIGTQVGKYHQAAMQIRGITVDDYVEARKYFIETLKGTILEGLSDQEVSVISQQNQREVFQEKDLIDGLENCSSQYDLIENFPLVGHAIQIRRSDGGMINPYMVSVVGMAKLHKVVDTVSIHQSDSNELVLSVGGHDEERANAVVPLFSNKDAVLSPLLKSKLYSILMTFNVMGNADTCFENAYFALLANTCVYLLNQPESEWRNNTLDLVGSTIGITQGTKEVFKKYATALIETPKIAVVTESPSIETKCEDLSKAIGTLFYLVWSKQLEDKDKIKEILLAIYQEEIGRKYPGEIGIDTYFSVVLPEGAVLPEFEEEEKKILEDFSDVTKFFTKYDLKREVDKAVDALPLKLGFEIAANFDLESCDFVKQGKLKRANLDKIFKYFCPDQVEPDNNQIAQWVYHASKFRNSYERNTTEIHSDLETILKGQAKQKESNILKNNKIAARAFEKLVDNFEQIMVENHFDVEPMTPEELKAYCEKNGLDSAVFIFNGASNLLTNACMSKTCPFFMKVTNQLPQHLESDIGRFPALHKTIKLNPTLSAEELIEKIVKGECLKPINDVIPLNLIPPTSGKKLEKFKERYIEFILKIKNYYNSRPGI